MQISSDTFFTYDGHQSYLYGLRFAWIDGSPESNMVSDKEYVNIRNSAQNTFKIAKSSYDDPITFDASMSSDKVLSDTEVRRIYKMFFDKNEFKELELPSPNGEKIYFNCVFTEVRKIEGGLGNRFGVIGFNMKIICDAPWGWTEDKIITPSFTVTGGKGRFTLRCNSDGHDYIYPRITVEVPATADAALNSQHVSRIGNPNSCLGCPFYTRCIEGQTEWPNALSDNITVATSITAGYPPVKAMIINESDDDNRGTCIILRQQQAQRITMDAALGTIKGVNIVSGTPSAMMPKVSQTNKKFIRLVPGDNNFYVENIGSGKISFIYREARILV